MSHYSLAQKPCELIPWSIKMAEQIKTTFEGGDIMPILLYSGMSGIATAASVAHSFYTLYGENLYMAYVRKPNEKSHGVDIEWESIVVSTSVAEESQKFFCLTNKMRNESEISVSVIFVDDFVSDGNTLIRCIEKFADKTTTGLRWDSKIFKTKKVWVCLCRDTILKDYSDISIRANTKPIRNLLKLGSDGEKSEKESLPPPTPTQEFKMTNLGPRGIGKADASFLNIDSIPSFSELGNVDAMKTVVMRDVKMAKKIEELCKNLFFSESLSYPDLSILNKIEQQTQPL